MLIHRQFYILCMRNMLRYTGMQPGYRTYTLSLLWPLLLTEVDGNLGNDK